ncbi:MAG TPA: VIT and VWA domain-containing protein, partial [Pirellulales bacterium]
MSTDPNPSEENSADNEIRLAAVLRTLDAENLKPDSALLAAVREQSLQRYAAASKAIRPRSAIWSRVVAVAAAIAAAVAITLSVNSYRSAGAVSPDLSSYFDNLQQASTSQFRVSKQGHTADVWVARGQVRLENSPTEYQIAEGSQSWTVDESNNTALRGTSPWFRSPHRPVDFLKFIDVDLDNPDVLHKARLVDVADYAGQKCQRFRFVVPGKMSELTVEAFADPNTKQLAGITTHAIDAAANSPPLAEIRLVAVNAPVDESKFIVAKSLTEDGRIGKIVDSQGLLVLRPALSNRWTPIGRETLLKMGDWVRTDIRGANAAKIRLSSDAELTLGPGTLLECISPLKARLHTGDVQCSLPNSGPLPPGEGRGEGAVSKGASPPPTLLPQKFQTFELLAPREGSRTVKSGSKELVRVDHNEKLVEVKTEPLWLKGFEGTSNNESLGSLIVNLPDGGKEPLSVGYHKVSVEIRDQIARTTIEESFVNHTPSRLEGVFYFPLPQDASISGFGMWIGNDLVEADVVEKQRAREIYETILREKRDPGLLEWTSGNLFKARVFPIEGNSEKRVKIVYTQVLPLRANRYRYSYGLRSDLLRTTPLRELSISVQVNSALPLKGITCPTHTVRTQQAAHSGQVEFAAQEYIPDRDFEVVCEIDGRNSDVVVVPHRRGDDGYLLLQITPPAKEGNWQREILPDGKPLQLVLLCDTSASMDSEKRSQQAEFVAAVLESLGDKDRFLLAAADVETTWVSPEPLAATPENIAKAREFLNQRTSLGWTNLDQAFAAVLKQAPTDAQVIYVGDGLVTAGEAEPVSFVKNLKRLIGTIPKSGGSTLHAVTVGNTNDSTVLQGIAAAGHGSVRSISGEQTPQIVAKELLNEIAQPGLRDLNVEFRGLKVAAIYPDHLPQVPSGTQQILVGRYLPTGKDQHGEVEVTGTLGGEPVRYTAQIDLKDAEAGNSFIPRLWARAQLDHLLAQGQSQDIHNQIIALSEQFHIITPYTSLLVLETDADRERFGVKRRFEMRDGERFFAKGRANANFELLQQQMKRAGDWRIGLRRQVLQNLTTLGRNPTSLQQQIQILNGYPARFGVEVNGFSSPPGLAGVPTARGGISGRMRNLAVSDEGRLSLLGSNYFDGETVLSRLSFSTSDSLASHDRRLGDRGGDGFNFGGSAGNRSAGEIDESAFDLGIAKDVDGNRSEEDASGLRGPLNV